MTERVLKGFDVVLTENLYRREYFDQYSIETYSI